MALKSRHKVDPAFNTAGMLDVIFILLIFFILTSKEYITPTIDASLPESKKSQQTVPNLVVTIQKTETGLKYFVNNNEIQFGALKSTIQKEISKNELVAGKVNNVVVRADGRVELKDAVAVTSMIGELGAKATFAVDPVK